MSQRFVKGYTNNHLTWVMVDATDFATPESAMSAATKLTIYGKTKGATTLNTVSTGTGSLTNDIIHVGPSATGIYTIALAKADLSDASAAWYDHYIVAISAAGAAHQVIIVDGGLLESYFSAVGSDTLSAAVALSGLVSDAHSAAILAASNASEAQSHATLAASRILLVQSRLSDFMSAIYPSDISDIRSMLTALSDAISNVQSETTSQFAVTSNYLSYISNVVSGLGAGASASAIADKVWSDYGSKVGATPSQAYSVALRGASFASDAASGVTVLLSRITSVTATSSDLVSKIWSDFTSKMGATPSQLYSVALVGASAASDAASAAQQANSRVILVQSRLSDFQSVYTSDISDIRSMLTALSDMVSDVQSDLRSYIGAGVPIGASDMSDLRSAIAAGPAATVTASDISDIASAVVAAAQAAILNVNVVQVNEITISGTGAAGNTWGPG